MHHKPIGTLCYMCMNMIDVGTQYYYYGFGNGIYLHVNDDKTHRAAALYSSEQCTRDYNLMY